MSSRAGPTVALSLALAACAAFHDRADVDAGFDAAAALDAARPDAGVPERCRWWASASHRLGPLALTNDAPHAAGWDGRAVVVRVRRGVFPSSARGALMFDGDGSLLADVTLPPIPVEGAAWAVHALNALAFAHPEGVGEAVMSCPGGLGICHTFGGPEGCCQEDRLQFWTQLASPAGEPTATTVLSGVRGREVGVHMAWTGRRVLIAIHGDVWANEPPAETSELVGRFLGLTSMAPELDGAILGLTLRDGDREQAAYQRLDAEGTPRGLPVVVADGSLRRLAARPGTDEVAIDAAGSIHFVSDARGVWNRVAREALGEPTSLDAMAFSNVLYLSFAGALEFRRGRPPIVVSPSYLLAVDPTTAEPLGRFDLPAGEFFGVVLIATDRGAFLVSFAPRGDDPEDDEEPYLARMLRCEPEE